jgi:hypothetical protein
MADVFEFIKDLGDFLGTVFFYSIPIFIFLFCILKFCVFLVQ